MKNEYFCAMISENVDLKPFNTFGVAAKAAQFTRFGSVDELNEILAAAEGQALFILGGGSNILLTQDIDALVLKNEIKGMELVEKDDDSVLVRVGAGEVWHEFVLYCVEHGYAGVENLSLIPGNVGASPMQNIGAYGVEVKDVIFEVEAFNLENKAVQVFSNEECEFGYRESVFKRALKGKYVITHVTFKLSANPKINTSYGAIESELKTRGISEPTIKDVSDAVIAIRQSKLPDPKEIGNAGSFFKNPVVEQSVFERIRANHPDVPSYPAETGKVKIPAGWLIEQAGWKGKTFENYGVHKNQALVLVNYGGATGRQIWDLSSMILEDINTKFGVELEREVNVI
ncbi:MAG: UDP-N-acetylenolpyruvoylglucosamine reductase [Crocinitomicaceae bacterium]|jgi:UDP-N-acetylmuramate dehydrogenase|nr:UDP-N-acetylenolpyruvoylglucosamine reductase [Crocinitomicaceae bacterium]